MNPLSVRRRLTAGFSGLLFIGLTAVAWIFIASTGPSAGVDADLDNKGPIEVEIGGLDIGEYTIVEWRDRPVIILRRDPAWVAQLAHINQRLYDPLSSTDPDPAYIRPVQRSIQTEYFVAFNISTFCNCGLVYTDTLPGLQAPGGLFFDPCHTGIYDLAGRLFLRGMRKPGPACNNERMTNMRIPPHHFKSRDVLVIGRTS